MDSQPWLTPWNKASYERFLNERLPELLAARLPLAGYRVEPEENAARKPRSSYNFGQVEWAPAADCPAACRVSVSLSTTTGLLNLVYPGIYQPDADGLFEVDGALRWVPPHAADENLATATIACVGEQLYELVAARLGQAPEGLPWSEALARAWLPLDAWINGFIRARGQHLDPTNWLARNTHTRRFILLKRDKVYAPGQNGRVCPFETPEGEYIGRIFTPASGAQIQGERLVINDPRPAASLGLSASMLPFLEHNDPNRLLMAANMLRQAIVPANPEPAWVQTGNEPDASGFWCGRNLLTAFVSWGEGSAEDAIILSESAARRLSDPLPLEAGDKLANRSGTMGVVSQILPDEQMPHLPDGSAVELVYNFTSLGRRMQAGLMREAVMSRIARAEGRPAIVPPFEAPTREEMQRRLAAAGLDVSGMERLSDGMSGPALERPSTVGWIYWNRLAHLAQRYLRVSLDGAEGQPLGDLEAQILRELGATALLADMLTTRPARAGEGPALAQRLAQGSLPPAEPPTPLFARLQERLGLAGIRAELREGQLSFRFAAPQGRALKLARPIAHPWLRGQTVEAIGIPPAPEGEQAPFSALLEANSRLERLLSAPAPERLLREALARLETQLAACFDALVPPRGYRAPQEQENALPGEVPAAGDGIAALLRIEEPQCFSACAVAAPGTGLGLEQADLPETVCWQLFGQLLQQELGSSAQLDPQDPRAAAALDQLLARQWVYLQHAPTLAPHALLAFHPRRAPGRVIRIDPLLCAWLNLDFNGSRLAVHLPLGAAAQRECQDLLSVRAHLRRDPGLLRTLLPPSDVRWGLAYRALQPGGAEEIARLARVEPGSWGSLFTQDSLEQLLETVGRRDGTEAALSTLAALTELGYCAARASGASLSPWIGSSLSLPPAPPDDSIPAWESYHDQVCELILSRKDYASLDLGPQLLEAHIRTQPRWRALTALAGIRGVGYDESGRPFIGKHGHSSGLSAAELFGCAVGARQGLANLYTQSEQLVRDALNRGSSRMTVLARARRAKQPGIVFARAAANLEVDPLEDPESRVLVGLPLR